ncbi:hypothetical protein [Ruminococcus sp. SR1/5]|uniref:hypothetical protein n=1 Tax=Ruminococcus sp. SR1/5 TaxID=657323 RepID=UPI0001CD5876|nr:hypothetical protein [Ruminococcus sp. SR1/5]CBL21500.1 hypothetical protein CK1_38070 [Ruminococcus sp. SR1/5]
MYREKHFFENLQELRGMAALLIVMSHIPLFKKMIGPSFGGYGVAIFPFKWLFSSVFDTKW